MAIRWFTWWKMDEDAIRWLQDWTIGYMELPRWLAHTFIISTSRTSHGSQLSLIGQTSMCWLWSGGFLRWPSGIMYPWPGMAIQWKWTGGLTWIPKMWNDLRFIWNKFLKQALPLIPKAGSMKMRKRFFILPLFSWGKVWYDVTGL